MSIAAVGRDGINTGQDRAERRTRAREGLRGACCICVATTARSNVAANRSKIIVKLPTGARLNEKPRVRSETKDPTTVTQKTSNLKPELL